MPPYGGTSIGMKSIVSGGPGDFRSERSTE